MSISENFPKFFRRIVSFHNNCNTFSRLFLPLSENFRDATLFSVFEGSPTVAARKKNVLPSMIPAVKAEPPGHPGGSAHFFRCDKFHCSQMIFEVLFRGSNRKEVIDLCNPYGTVLAFFLDFEQKPIRSDRARTVYHIVLRPCRDPVSLFVDKDESAHSRLRR